LLVYFLLEVVPEEASPQASLDVLSVEQERGGERALVARGQRGLRSLGGAARRLVWIGGLCSSCLSWQRNGVQQINQLQQKIEHRLDQRFIEELLSIEVANLIERKQAKVDQLAEFIVASDVVDVKQCGQGLLDELHVEACLLRVLQQIDCLRQDEAEDGPAAEGILPTRDLCLLTNTAILVLLDVVPEGTIPPRELVARVGLLDVRINKVAAGIGLEGGFALVLHERRLGGIGLQKLVEIPEAADHSEKALLGDNSEVKIMPGGVAQLRSRGISLVLGIGAALQEVKQCLDDISPLEEDLWREVLQIPRLEHRARLEHCLSIAELQRHGQVKEHLLILLGHEDERQLARLLQHLLLVHDLHMALVYS